MKDDLDNYLEEVSEPICKFCLENREAFETGRCRNHPGKQKLPGGLKFHTLQVIKKALELNQVLDRREIIETTLVHDIKGYEKLPLSKCQKMAIAATKGLPYREWRPTECYKFVVLILIADMWSAFINERDLYV